MHARVIVLLLTGFLFSLTACSTPEFLSESGLEEFGSTGEGIGFRPGERVVLLGNSLFENDLEHGWLEFGLTAGWPEHGLTFRNLGWTGDTVFGESRGTYTRPPDAWGHLKLQLEDAGPDVVWIAYGGVEMADGEAGLERFNTGVHRLLDTVVELGARAVLLSPLPYLSAEGRTAPYDHLDLYSRTLAGIAAERELPYIDLTEPLRAAQAEQKISDNGIHLNETGYITLACFLLERSGRPLHCNEDGFIFGSGEVSGGYAAQEGAGSAGTDDRNFLAGHRSDPEWLRSRIVQKNRLYLQYYRPINRTYLTGFRAYEQGYNAPELEKFREGAEELDREIKRYLESEFGQ